MTRTAFQRLSRQPRSCASVVPEGRSRPPCGPSWNAAREAGAGQGRPGADRQTVRTQAGQVGRNASKPGWTCPADPGISLEQTGIDYSSSTSCTTTRTWTTLSNIAGVGIEGSNRATDLDMKTELLRAARRPSGSSPAPQRHPIANTVTEVYDDAALPAPGPAPRGGVDRLRLWAATFGQAVDRDGTGPAPGPVATGSDQEPVRAIPNVPELLRMWHAFADVKTADELHLPTPTVAARPRRCPRPRNRARRTHLAAASSTWRSSGGAPRRSRPARSTPATTTCSRSAATAARPPWTCASSRPRRADR